MKSQPKKGDMMRKIEIAFLALGVFLAVPSAQGETIAHGGPGFPCVIAGDATPEEFALDRCYEMLKKAAFGIARLESHTLKPNQLEALGVSMVRAYSYPKAESSLYLIAYEDEKTAKARYRDAAKLLKEWGLFKSSDATYGSECVLISVRKERPSDSGFRAHESHLLFKFSRAPGREKQ